MGRHALTVVHLYADGEFVDNLRIRGWDDGHFVLPRDHQHADLILTCFRRDLRLIVLETSEIEWHIDEVNVDINRDVLRITAIPRVHRLRQGMLPDEWYYPFDQYSQPQCKNCSHSWHAGECGGPIFETLYWDRYDGYGITDLIGTCDCEG
ncbi:hypothetical protein FHT44_005025 [Mycolicibacterium sp. BK634]|uniref:hypothetical protein n=1 Tax=Mycolicibacterium sp. BK634 TaxID=2587099 RepID=UPI001619FDEC|nr:hypothetical protein [Mycolicibacterium sp. BK634]MBB3752513.1 hypothetical protein [Mycolicibacterium sp. BK634]